MKFISNKNKLIMVASYLDIPWKFLLNSIFHSICIFFHTHNHAWAAYIHVRVILLSKTHNGDTKKCYKHPQ